MSEFNKGEAARCLLCKIPKCSLQGCPAKTPVPEAMALYREGRLDQAGELLFRNNPLSAITSLVCDWKKFCFGHCVLNVKGVPVHWYGIEQEISAKYLFKATLERESRELEGKRIAIVGAGPAGIAASIFLYRMGADITLFDANPRIGGVLRYGIPPFRLDRTLVDQYERILDVPGIDIRCSTRIDSITHLAGEFSSVIVCAGAEKPMSLGIPGEEKALQALEYLKEPGKYDIGRKVIVIGGGNVAMDACRTAVRTGADTWVYYRKTFRNMPANPLEVEDAQKEGVRFALFKAPVEVREDGVVFRDCENVVPEDGGRVVTHIIEGTDHFVPCDTLITAISEKSDTSILPEVLPHNVILAGDFLTGPATVVEAVASARAIAQSLV